MKHDQILRAADVYFQNILAGKLMEHKFGNSYSFRYHDDYSGYPISLTMPVEKKEFLFDQFPPFFDGLLPEGYQLEALLKQKKIDRNDLFGQLVQIGRDTVGAVTIKEFFNMGYESLKVKNDSIIAQENSSTVEAKP